MINIEREVTTIERVKEFLKDPYNFLLFTFVIYFIFALIVDTPQDIFVGLKAIVASQDILITDYLYLGGVGATLVNAATLGIASVVLMKFFKCEHKGTNIMAIWLMVGFGFFGKNLFNAAPIVFGGYLYALYHKKHFSNYISNALLATSLSPVTSQMCFIGLESTFLGIVLGIIVGIFLGFIMIPISAFTLRAHAGYNLYNSGFAAGILSLVIVSLLRNAGINIEPLDLWSEGNNLVLLIFSLTINLLLIITAAILSGNDLKNIVNFKSYKDTYAIMDDRYIKHGEVAYLNMGFMGIMSILFIVLIGGELSGPLIGGIFTIIGFSCVGKNLFNIAPPMIGCCLVIIFHGWDITSSGYLLTILFSATLAPISSSFGIHWGIIAGVLHINLAVTLTSVHGGLNLYNNGMAGGFIAMLLVPVILSIKKKL